MRLTPFRVLAAAAAFILLAAGGATVSAQVTGGFWMFCDGSPLVCTETTPPTVTVTTTVEEPPPPPAEVQILEPAAGATVTGTVNIRVSVPEGTDWVGVFSGFCPGNSIGEDLEPDAPNEFNVAWDTTLCDNGPDVNVDAWAFDDDGSNYGNHTISVVVDNPVEPPPPPPGECPPAGEPAPIAGQGYEQVFADCFDTLDRATWCDRQWWESAPPVGSQTVANGELRLRRTRSTGYANTTMSTEPCGQANPRSFTGGYMEARIRYETVRGNGPAFWLFSTRHATNPAWPSINPVCAQQGLPSAECLSAELDVFEGFGNIQYGGTRTDDFFSGTLHRNSSGDYGQANQSRFVQSGTGLEMETYHTYAARWTPTSVSFYIDGQLQGSAVPFDSFDQPMHLLLYNWTTGWEDENVPDASSENELDVFVDWVRVWQQPAPPPPPPGDIACLISNRDEWELAGTDCAFGTQINQTNGQWLCNQPLSNFGPLPIKVVHTYTTQVNTGDQGGMDIVSGCRGDGNSDTVDLIYHSNANGTTLGSCGGGGKFRTAPGPRDLQVTGNFDGAAVCGGAHQDGLQMHPAMLDNNLDVVNGTSGDWDAGTATVIGAGGSIFFSDRVDLNVYGGRYVTCNHGYFGASSTTNLVVDAGFRTGAQNATCAGTSTSDPCIGVAQFQNVTAQRWINGAWANRPCRT